MSGRGSFRRRKKSGGRVGLWVGLGLGGLALVAAVVIATATRSSNRTGSNPNPGLLNLSGPGRDAFVGRWEVVNPQLGTPLPKLVFTDDNVFHQIMPDDAVYTFGTYRVSGNTATVTMSKTAYITIQGQRVLTVRAVLVGDELRVTFLDITQTYRKVK